VPVDPAQFPAAAATTFAAAAATTFAAAAAEARERLTGPGGEFELAEAEVHGVPLPVFVNRAPSLRGWLDASVRDADVEYVVDGRHRLTYAAHRRAVLDVAADLTAAGVQPGDRVLILAANSAEWVVTFWASAMLGAIVVAGNAWWTQREIGYAVAHTEPAVIVADERRRERLGEVRRPVLAIEDLLTASTGTASTGTASTDTVATLPDVTVADDDPAVIMYTSGTTGLPKGAVHSHRCLLSVIEYHRLNDAVLAALGAGAGHRRFLMSLPLFHIASLHNLVLPRLAVRDTVVIDSGRFDAERVLALVESERITNWAVVPTMAHRIAAVEHLERYDLSSLGALSINSAPSSQALKARLRTALPGIGATLADSYGMTETGTAVTVATGADLALHPSTVGRAVVTVQVQIRAADGTELPDGVEGEICVRTGFGMLGYWRDEVATAAMIAPDGWLRTGDIGSQRDGYLFMSTRRTDLILRGGENVYPAEIEAVLDEHPAVAESAVFGVDHADLGQEVAALVVVAPGTQPTPDDLIAFVAHRLAYYKVPSRWQLRSEPLARTATGKVIRAGLTG
jgi:acyl-CoA synthetase (AMP-forming)/AMP-acid ligase II